MGISRAYWRSVASPRAQLAMSGLLAAGGALIALLDSTGRVGGLIILFLGAGFLLAVLASRMEGPGIVYERVGSPQSRIQVLTIPLRRGRERQLAMFGGFAVAGALALVAGDSLTGRMAAGRWLFAGIGIFAALFVAEVLRTWRQPLPGIHLTVTGIAVRSVGASRSVRWDHVASVRRGEVVGNASLLIDTTHPGAVLMQASPLGHLFAMGGQPGGADLMVPLVGLATSPDAVARLITWLHERPGERQRLLDTSRAILERP